MRIEAKLEEMGLVLPEPARLPPGVRLSFVWVRARGDRVYVSGHGPLNPDGSPAGPFGKVGVEVSPEEGYGAARLTALSRQPQERVGRPGPGERLARGPRHGQRGPGLQGDDQRDQWLLGPDPVVLRPRSRDVRSHGRWHSRATTQAPGHDYRGGRNTKLIAEG